MAVLRFYGVPLIDPVAVPFFCFLLMPPASCLTEVNRVVCGVTEGGRSCSGLGRRWYRL